MKALAPESVKLRDDRVVIICPAVPDDAETILNYMSLGLPECTDYVRIEPDEFGMSVKQERDWIVAQKHASGAIVLLAKAANEVIGMLDCDSSSRRQIAHVGEIGMAVRKTYWGSGLGSAMMTSLINWAQAHPVLEMLQLSVFADNHRAIGLYRKFDFVEAGRLPQRTKFGPGEYKDDVIMYRRVDACSEGGQP